MTLTCIVCPMGCELHVEKTAQGLVVTGHHCPRGVSYAENEVQDPHRVYTGNIPIRCGELPVISFKTQTMRKADWPYLQQLLRQLNLCAPIALGDILYQDERVTIIATRRVERTNSCNGI